MTSPPDPGALFREMLGQWEQMANQLGGQAMTSGEFSRVMQGTSSAAMTAQGAVHQMMDKALAAANMPSRSEVEDLSARVRRIEEAVGRIEALLMAQASTTSPGFTPPTRPAPKRTRSQAEKPA